MQELDPKWVQLTINETNRGLFQADIISVHFGSATQNVLKSDLKIHGLVPFGAKLTHFESKYDLTIIYVHPGNYIDPYPCIVLFT